MKKPADSNVTFKKGGIKKLNAKGAEWMNDWIHQLEPEYSVKVGDEVMITDDSDHPFCVPMFILTIENSCDDIDIDDFTYSLNESHFC